MELELWVLALLCCTFFCTGFIDAVSGGGGLIALPAMLLAGVPPDLALGTNKMAVALGTPASIITYARGHFVLWRLAVTGIPAAFLGGLIGANILLVFDGETIGKIILFLLPLAVGITLMPKKGSTENREITPNLLYVRTPVISCLVGLYDGFFGPGAGSFFIIGLHSFAGIGLIHASATTKILCLGSVVSSFAVFCLNGKVLFLLGLPLAAANALGGIAGSRMAMRIGAGFVRAMLSGVLCLLMISLVWKLYFA